MNFMSDISIFMFYIFVITITMIICLFVFKKLNINLWYSMTTGIIIGMMLCFIMWTFYGKKHVVY